MVTTMISPEALIGGKGLGLFAVSLTQIAIWIVSVVVVIIVGAQFLPPLQQAIIPWGYLLLVLAYFLPAFALIAGVMTAIGGAVAEVQQGQQIAALLNLLFIFPFFFMAALLTNPNGPLALFLTLFPTTSFLTVALRWGLGSIPLWQLVVSWLLLVATAVFTMWAAARIFRVGMLRYGQRLSLRRMLAAIQGGSHA
ncbi:MAG: ABC transporter permease [Chloroflexi bacterium]|nr:ABC transporter permease [Chloroflexota bacterium]